jgi:hypothetical protein
VVSVNGNTLVLTLSDGTQKTFTGDASTRLPSDLRAGQQVRVSGQVQADGSYQGLMVTIDPRSAGNASMGRMAAPGRNDTPATDAMDADDKANGSTMPSASGMSMGRSSDRSAGHGKSASGTQSTDLPRTASPLPYIGLAGVLVLGAGLGLRSLVR